MSYKKTHVVFLEPFFHVICLSLFSVAVTGQITPSIFINLGLGLKYLAVSSHGEVFDTQL